MAADEDRDRGLLGTVKKIVNPPLTVLLQVVVLFAVALAVLQIRGLLGSLATNDGQWPYWARETAEHLGMAGLANMAFDMSKKLTKLREAAKDVEEKALELIKQTEKR